MGDDGLEVALVDTPGFTFKLPTDVTDETLADLRAKEMLFHRRGLFEKMKTPVNAGRVDYRSRALLDTQFLHRI